MSNLVVYSEDIDFIGTANIHRKYNHKYEDLNMFLDIKDYKNDSVYSLSLLNEEVKAIKSNTCYRIVINYNISNSDYYILNLNNKEFNIIKYFFKEYFK